MEHPFRCDGSAYPFCRVFRRIGRFPLTRFRGTPYNDGPPHPCLSACGTTRVPLDGTDRAEPHPATIDAGAWLRPPPRPGDVPLVSDRSSDCAPDRGRIGLKWKSASTFMEGRFHSGHSRCEILILFLTLVPGLGYDRSSRSTAIRSRSERPPADSPAQARWVGNRAKRRGAGIIVEPREGPAWDRESGAIPVMNLTPSLVTSAYVTMARQT